MNRETLPEHVGMELGKPKPLELNLVWDMKGNKKDLYGCITNTRKTRENVDLLLLCFGLYW